MGASVPGGEKGDGDRNAWYLRLNQWLVAEAQRSRRTRGPLGLRLNDELDKSASEAGAGGEWEIIDFTGMKKASCCWDGGPGQLTCPHAHADLLTFEASFGGARLFVDSGVGSYQNDGDRRYCRSTAAHNALEIDGMDQCDVWSKFRMGYRGWPSGLTVGVTSGFSWARASHNALSASGRAERWAMVCLPVRAAPGSAWIGLTEKESTDMRIRLHLHPDVQVEQATGGEVRMRLAGRTLMLRFLSRGELTVEAGRYYPEMGVCEPAKVVCWRTVARCPLACGWVLTWKGQAGRAELEGGDIRDLRVRWIEEDGSTEIRPRAGGA